MNFRVTLCTAVFSLLVGTSSQASIVSKNFSASFADGSTLEGMFSGDTGADAILDATELTGFMMNSSGVPFIADFTVSPVDPLPFDSVFAFQYDSGANVLVDTGSFIFAGSENLLPDLSLYIATVSGSTLTTQLRRDAINTQQGNVVSGDYVISDKAPEVPEPASILLVLSIVAVLAKFGQRWQRPRT